MFITTQHPLPFVSLFLFILLLNLIFSWNGSGVHGVSTTPKSGIVTLSVVRPPLHAALEGHENAAHNLMHHSNNALDHLIITSPHACDAVHCESIQYVKPSSYKRTTPTRASLTSFNLTNLSPGPYVIEIVSAYYEYPLLRLDVSAKSGKVRLMRNDASQKIVRVHSSSVTSHADVAHLQQVPSMLSPLTTYRIDPIQPLQYFTEKPPFTITHHLKNPMVLVALFSVVVLIFMPMIAQSESMKEVQGMIGDSEDALGGFLDSLKQKANHAGAR